MDYLQGPSLDKNEKQPSQKDMWNYSRQLLSALNTCHEQEHVLHRDIKPDNLMLNNLGELVLIDFGCSSKFEGNDDQVYNTAGTYNYCAPEVMSTGEEKKMFGKKIDIWAAGVTLY